jgi:hypothetical protein
VNILEWNWDERISANDYCYGADALGIGGETDNHITFFVFEWTNPRLGKVIQEIRLKGTTRFRGASSEYDNEWGPIIGDNAVILKAISMMQKRS